MQVSVPSGMSNNGFGKVMSYCCKMNNSWASNLLLGPLVFQKIWGLTGPLFDKLNETHDTSEMLFPSTYFVYIQVQYK